MWIGRIPRAGQSEVSRYRLPPVEPLVPLELPALLEPLVLPEPLRVLPELFVPLNRLPSPADPLAESGWFPD